MRCRRPVSGRGAGSSAQRFETRDERSDTRSDDGIHMSYYGINSCPNEGGFMARLKRSKKAGSPPSPVRGFKVPKMAKRTESTPDMRADSGPQITCSSESPRFASPCSARRAECACRTPRMPKGAAPSGRLPSDRATAPRRRRARARRSWCLGFREGNPR